MTDLKVSTMAWGRFKKILFATSLVGGGAVVSQYLTGGGLMFDANGLVMRDRVLVSAAYDARIRKVNVRPGDFVNEGDLIALVESPSLVRSLSEMAAERARLEGKIAQLKSRRQMVQAVIPFAENNAKQAKLYSDAMVKAGLAGVVVNKSVNDGAMASLTASERHLTLVAERESIMPELVALQDSHKETKAAYERLREMYSNGELRSPVSGVIGNTIASMGEVLAASGSTRVATVYTGSSYVLAYLPQSYLFDIGEGQDVVVKAQGLKAQAKIDRILPVTDALPPEFQSPGRMRDRGQIIRINLPEAAAFPTEQKITVTTCVLTGCSESFDKEAGVIVASYMPKAKERVNEVLSDAQKVATRLVSEARSLMALAENRLTIGAQAFAALRKEERR